MNLKKRFLTFSFFHKYLKKSSNIAALHLNRKEKFSIFFSSEYDPG